MAFPHGLRRTWKDFILDRSMFVLAGLILYNSHRIPNHNSPGTQDPAAGTKNSRYGQASSNEVKFMLVHKR